MGATNVAKVFANWQHLKHREARALAFMANMALDADKPPVYFGGWEAVASALGLDCEIKRSSSKEVYRQTVAALVSAGAIVSSGQAKLGVRAEYALALDPDVTFQPVGTGRNIKWDSEPRPKRGNETLPHLPQRSIAPRSNETLPHVGQRNIGERDNVSLPPRSTEEPQGGIPDESTRGTTLRSSYATREPLRGNDKFDPLNEEDAAAGFHRDNHGLTVEQERQKQMAALEKLMAAERQAS